MSNTSKFKDVLYFIDDSVSDVESIVRAIPASAEARIFGSTEDGVSQIRSALAGKHDISAIHLVSHGRPGGIVLGASVIDITTLTARAEDFIAIGRALASDADLLIYGCNVAEGEGGKAFLAKLSDLTGANVAASETLTGAAHLGGDWNLEVRLGSVQAPVLNIPSYAGVLSAPVIGGLSPIAYTEDGAPQFLAPGVTFTGGLGYAGGSITFDVSGATSNDQMTLFSDSDPNATGAISVDASGNVYLGNGTSRDLLGTVDATENGQNGQPLTIHFIGNSTGVFNDSSFESDDPTTGWQSEWTVVTDRVILGTDPIAGWPSPADTTLPTGSDGTVSPGDGGPMVDPLAFNVDVVTGGDNASDGNRGLRLHSQDDTADPGQLNSEPDGIIHGPYVYSDAFAANAGDILRFDWKAEGGDDAFDAFGYLLNADTGETVICLNQTGTSATATTPWATASVIVPSDGNWQFVFVSGSFDYTGGQKTGGSLYIDNFSVQRAVVDDAVLGALAQHVQFENTSDTPPDAPRTVTVEVADGSGTSQTANTDIDITPANDAAVVSSDTKDLTETDSVLSTGGTLTITDVDSPATFVAQSNVAGDYGTFSIGTDGNWTYVASSAHDEFQAGQTYTDTFSVTAADGTATTVTVNLTGTNDAPVVSGAVTGAVTEDDTGVTLDALENASDVDAGDVLTVVGFDPSNLPAGVTYDPTTHSFTLDPTHPAYQSLGAGQTTTVTVGYNVSDGTATVPASVSWTVAGTNDAPVVSGAVTGAATEGGTGVTLDALENASDVDAGDVLTVVGFDPSNLPAGVTYDPTTHSFTLDPTHPAYQSIAAGTSQTVTVEYSVSDGTTTRPASVSWTVTGTNDAAVVSSDTKDLTETDSVLSTGGTLTITDVDSPASFVAQSNVAGDYGTFSIGTDGNWTYVASSAHDEFQAGQTYTDTFSVTAADGTATTVTVNLTGTNDAAVLSPDTKDLTETNSVLSTGGTLTITDVDSPATFVAQSNVAGDYGTFSIGSDGNWTYVASSVHDEFQAGQTYTDTFTVASADGTTTTVTVNLNGTNDVPSGGVAVAGEPTQGKVLTATNDVVDPEGIDPSSVAYQWQRQQPDGTWVNIAGAIGITYALTQDDVDAGHVRAVMSYTDLGGTSETVPSDAIPVANVNDAPTGAVTITGEVREGQLLTAVNTLADEDGLGTLTYQWMADGVAIQGATGSTLTLAHDQIGKTITVAINYTDGYGTAENVSSPGTSIVISGNAFDDHFFGGSRNDQLLGGTGNDRLDGLGGRDKLFGEDGNDTISGGADNDTVDGGSGNDQLFGNSGKDRLYGNSGRDKLFGGDSNDTISGGADNDTVDGGSGNDRFDGGSGNDALKGGSGNDWIIGGVGQDKLWGGSGADVFDYNSAQESRVGSQRDIIYDFHSGQDRIDLRGIDANEHRKGNQAFTWTCMDGHFLNPDEVAASVLNAGFTGKAGQLRYDHGILMGDTDGDRKADFQIKIVGHFSSADLLL